MMVKIDGVNVNITEELQELLRQNPPREIKKAVISKKKNDQGDLVHDTDEDGNKKYVKAEINTHPFVYFDAYGKHYLRSFRSKVIDEKEILITNPNIKTDKNCKLYGKGLISHRQIIPGSELWDNGSDVSMQHTETVCKGDPTTLIVKTMTRDEVLAVSLKPTGDSIVAKVANSSDAEKKVIMEELFGKDFVQVFNQIKEQKEKESEEE